MSLTKIQPSGLDETKDYAVNTLTANTVVIGGIELIPGATGGVELAQGAFDVGNTNSGLITTLQGVNAYQNTTITAVSTYAQSAYSEANATSTIADSAYIQAQAANTKMSASYNKANAVGILAQAAFNAANTGGGGGGSGIVYTASDTTPVTATVGDQWYSTTQDILYEYLDVGGGTTAWVDITGPASTETNIAMEFNPLVFLTSGM